MQYSDIIECFEPPTKTESKGLKIIKQGKKRPPRVKPKSPRVKPESPRVKPESPRVKPKPQLPPPPKKHRGDKVTNKYYRNYYVNSGYPNWWVDRYYPDYYDYVWPSLWYDYYRQPIIQEPPVTIINTQDTPTTQKQIEQVPIQTNQVIGFGLGLVSGFIMIIFVIFFIMRK